MHLKDDPNLAQEKPVLPSVAGILHFSVPPTTPLSIEPAITQMLDNVVNDLDSLRRSIETAQQKHIQDVRDFGDTAAGQHLRGIEEPISYFDLVKLINNMRLGTARRRVALAEVESS